MYRDLLGGGGFLELPSIGVFIGVREVPTGVAAISRCLSKQTLEGGNGVLPMAGV